MAWIGVDLDCTLAIYDKWRGENHIGEPIPAMVERVKQWRAQGQEVRIFTARVAGHGMCDITTGGTIDAITPIQEWCQKHLGEVLPITNVKDFGMMELYDDRCVQVEANTGRLLTNAKKIKQA